MFFAPVLRKGNAVAPASQDRADLGFQRFMNETVRGLFPSLYDLQEDERTWTLTIDAPGIAKGDLHVDIIGNMVKVETSRESKRQLSAHYQLPADIDAAKSQARLEDGVLTLTLAKVESAQARRIAVK